MLIKFKKPDPRAGMTARMDSSRGQQLIDAGSASRVSEGAQAEPVPEARAVLEAALRELPGDYDDPDYVVLAMRRHFSGVFTDTDEAKVRELVVKPHEPAAEPPPADIDQPSEAVEGQAQDPADAPKPARGKKSGSH